MYLRYDQPVFANNRQEFYLGSLQSNDKYPAKASHERQLSDCENQEFGRHPIIVAHQRGY